MHAMTRPDTAPGSSEAGFTLIEAMVAIVVLLVGVASVANLMVVAASSNTVANQATAAATIASQEIERLSAIPYDQLVVGGDLTADTSVGATDFFSEQDLPGVGVIHTRWVVVPIAGDNQTRFIQVRSEATGALTGPRSRADFTIVRSCTSTTIGCPAP
jgi:prepilin-type N-terminal cleavage/methylation domain-containing protein